MNNLTPAPSDAVGGTDDSRLVVVGATGFVGAHLLARLQREGIRARCTFRREANRKVLEDLGMEPCRADVRNYESLEKAFHNAEVIINLTTLIHEQRRGDYQDVFYKGMANIIRAAQTHGIRRIIHLSALSSHGSEMDSTHPYLYWKQRGADLLRDSGLEATVFEPSIVFGPGDQHLSVLALALKCSPIIPIAGRRASEAWVQPVWVEDVVECLIGAWRNQASVGRTFGLTGPDVWQVRDLFAVVADLLGKRFVPWVVPNWSIRAAAAPLGMLFRYNPLPPELIAVSGMADSFGDSSDTYTFFGMTPTRLADRYHYLGRVGVKDLRRWIVGGPHSEVLCAGLAKQ